MAFSEYMNFTKVRACQSQDSRPVKNQSFNILVELDRRSKFQKNWHGVPWDSQGKLKWSQLKTFKAEDFKTLPYPGNNVIVVSNHGLKTEGKNSRKGEFWKEMPDIN